MSGGEYKSRQKWIYNRESFHVSISLLNFFSNGNFCLCTSGVSAVSEEPMHE